MFSHWTTGGRKGRMFNGGQTLDPAITQSVLMNTYTAANHDMHSITTRNGKYNLKHLLTSASASASQINDNTKTIDKVFGGRAQSVNFL